jgi:manganese-dependent inorganic pyrophosphatase
MNNETKYLLELFNIDTPETVESFEEGTKIALVDHNEKSQSINNYDELNIEYIIDHHKLNVSTSNPVNVRMEKLTSTASVLYLMYKEA